MSSKNEGKGTHFYHRLFVSVSLDEKRAEIGDEGGVLSWLHQSIYLLIFIRSMVVYPNGLEICLLA